MPAGWPRPTPGPGGGGAQKGRPGLLKPGAGGGPCPPQRKSLDVLARVRARVAQSARSSSAAMAAQAHAVWGSDVPGFVFLLSRVFSVPPAPTAAAVWTPPVRLLGSPLRRTYLLDGLISSSSFPGSRVLSRVLVRLPPSPWPGLQRIQDGPWCPGRLCGPCPHTPAPAPAGAPPAFLSRLQGFCPGRKGAQARTPEPPRSLVPVQPRGHVRLPSCPFPCLPKGAKFSAGGQRV